MPRKTWVNRVMKPSRARKTSALRCKLRMVLRETGIGGIIRAGARKLISDMRKLGSLKKDDSHPFDLKYGTDTSGTIEPEVLDTPDEKAAHAARYQAAIVEVFIDILKGLAIPYEEFLFVDLGSGKGRSLLLASHFPFKEILGVELSPSLHRIACRNIEIYRDSQQKCHNISSRCDDAANYEIPNENIVFYLFNPFDGHVMHSVLSNIEYSVQRYARDIYIAYLNPVYRDIFDRSRFLRLVNKTERYIIYKNKTAASLFVSESHFSGKN